MFVNGSGRKEQSVLMNFHRCILPNFGSLDKALSDEKILEIDQSETRIASGGHRHRQFLFLIVRFF
jgi:hypothetical protein